MRSCLSERAQIFSEKMGASKASNKENLLKDRFFLFASEIQCIIEIAANP